MRGIHPLLIPMVPPRERRAGILIEAFGPYTNGSYWRFGDSTVVFRDDVAKHRFAPQRPLEARQDGRFRTGDIIENFDGFEFNGVSMALVEELQSFPNPIGWSLHFPPRTEWPRPVLLAWSGDYLVGMVATLLPVCREGEWS